MFKAGGSHWSCGMIQRITATGPHRIKLSIRFSVEAYECVVIANHVYVFSFIKIKSLDLALFSAWCSFPQFYNKASKIHNGNTELPLINIDHCLHFQYLMTYLMSTEEEVKNSQTIWCLRTKSISYVSIHSPLLYYIHSELAVFHLFIYLLTD